MVLETAIITDGKNRKFIVKFNEIRLQTDYWGGQFISFMLIGDCISLLNNETIVGGFGIEEDLSQKGISAEKLITELLDKSKRYEEYKTDLIYTDLSNINIMEDKIEYVSEALEFFKSQIRDAETIEEVDNIVEKTFDELKYWINNEVMKEIKVLTIKSKAQRIDKVMKAIKDLNTKINSLIRVKSKNYDNSVKMTLTKEQIKEVLDSKELKEKWGGAGKRLKELALTNQSVMKRIQRALSGGKTIFKSKEERDFANNLIKKMKKNGETDSKTYKDLKRKLLQENFLAYIIDKAEELFGKK